MNYNIYCMKAALKVIPPILLCWPTTSNADVGGMAVEVEPSCQYSITLCCCVTDGSRGAVWRYDVWQKVNMMQRSVTEFLHVNKKGTRWHSSTLTKCLWRTNSGCEHSEGWVVHSRSGNSDSGSPPLLHIFMSAACRLLFITEKKCTTNGGYHVEK